MKSRILSITAGLALIPLLSACGALGFGTTPTPAPSTEASTESQLPVVTAQKEDSSRGVPGILKCRSGLMSVDIPLGSHQETDGASYQLNEKKTEDKYDDPETQVSVALTVKLSASTALPAMIVHSHEGKGTYGGADPLSDKLLDLKIGAGGAGSFTLPTTAYTNFPGLGDLITGVTLCLDVSQSPKASS